MRVKYIKCGYGAYCKFNLILKWCIFVKQICLFLFLFLFYLFRLNIIMLYIDDILGYEYIPFVPSIFKMVYLSKRNMSLLFWFLFYLFRLYMFV